MSEDVPNEEEEEIFILEDEVGEDDEIKCEEKTPVDVIVIDEEGDDDDVEEDDEPPLAKDPSGGVQQLLTLIETNWEERIEFGCQWWTVPPSQTPKSGTNVPLHILKSLDKFWINGDGRSFFEDFGKNEVGEPVKLENFDNEDGSLALKTVLFIDERSYCPRGMLFLLLVSNSIDLIGPAFVSARTCILARRALVKLRIHQMNVKETTVDNKKERKAIRLALRDFKPQYRILFGKEWCEMPKKLVTELKLGTMNDEYWLKWSKIFSNFGFPANTETTEVVNRSITILFAIDEKLFNNQLFSRMDAACRAPQSLLTAKRLRDTTKKFAYFCLVQLDRFGFFPQGYAFLLICLMQRESTKLESAIEALRPLVDNCTAHLTYISRQANRSLTKNADLVARCATMQKAADDLLLKRYIEIFPHITSKKLPQFINESMVTTESKKIAPASSVPNTSSVPTKFSTKGNSQVDNLSKHSFMTDWAAAFGLTAILPGDALNLACISLIEAVDVLYHGEFIPLTTTLLPNGVQEYFREALRSDIRSAPFRFLASLNNWNLFPFGFLPLAIRAIVLNHDKLSEILHVLRPLVDNSKDALYKIEAHLSMEGKTKEFVESSHKLQSIFESLLLKGELLYPSYPSLFGFLGCTKIPSQFGVWLQSLDEESRYRWISEMKLPLDENGLPTLTTLKHHIIRPLNVHLNDVPHRHIPPPSSIQSRPPPLMSIIPDPSISGYSTCPPPTDPIPFFDVPLPPVDPLMGSFGYSMDSSGNAYGMPCSLGEPSTSKSAYNEEPPPINGNGTCTDTFVLDVQEQKRLDNVVKDLMGHDIMAVTSEDEARMRRAEEKWGRWLEEEKRKKERERRQKEKEERYKDIDVNRKVREINKSIDEKRRQRNGSRSPRKRSRERRDEGTTYGQATARPSVQWSPSRDDERKRRHEDDERKRRREDDDRGRRKKSITQIGFDHWKRMEGLQSVADASKWEVNRSWGVTRTCVVHREHLEWEEKAREGMTRLDTVIADYFSNRVQRSTDYDRKLTVWSRLASCLQSRLGHNSITLLIAGSSNSLLSTRESNLDLILVSQNEILTGVDLRNLVFPSLMHLIGEMGGIVTREEAFWLDFTCTVGGAPLSVRIAVDNGAVFYSRLIKIYDSLDNRLSALCLYIKRWAAVQFPSREVSRYLLTCLLIHFLQCGVSPPVLPCLNTLYPSRVTPDSTGSFDAISNLNPPPPVRENNQSLGSLFIGFFLYFSSFPFEDLVISIRCGTLFKRSDIPRSLPHIAVENPFDGSFTPVVDAPISCDLFRHSMAVAAETLLTKFDVD